MCALAREPGLCAHSLSCISLHCFTRRSLKRLYTSPAKLSEEMIEVLESISDVDAVLTHAAYLELIGATKGSTVYREIKNLIQHHNQTPRSDPTSSCMCEAYHKSVDRFGSFYKEQAASAGNPERFSTVASESLMWSRGVLSFYTDTVRCSLDSVVGTCPLTPRCLLLYRCNLRRCM